MESKKLGRTNAMLMTLDEKKRRMERERKRERGDDWRSDGVSKI